MLVIFYLSEIKGFFEVYSFVNVILCEWNIDIFS